MRLKVQERAPETCTKVRHACAVLDSVYSNLLSAIETKLLPRELTVLFTEQVHDKVCDYLTSLISRSLNVLANARWL